MRINLNTGIYKSKSYKIWYPQPILSNGLVGGVTFSVIRNQFMLFWDNMCMHMYMLMEYEWYIWIIAYLVVLLDVIRIMTRCWWGGKEPCPSKVTVPVDVSIPRVGGGSDQDAFFQQLVELLRWFIGATS